MLAAYRTASFHPIGKVITSPSPSGRGVGVRAREPPATVLPKPNQSAAKHRYSRNEPPESLVRSDSIVCFCPSSAKALRYSGKAGCSCDTGCTSQGNEKRYSKRIHPCRLEIGNFECRISWKPLKRRKNIRKT